MECVTPMPLARPGFILGAHRGRVVELSGRFNPRVFRKVCGGVITAALHTGLLFVILLHGGEGGVDSGDVPALKLVLLQASEADHAAGVDLPPLPPVAPAEPSAEQAQVEVAKAILPPGDTQVAQVAQPLIEESPPPQVIEPTTAVSEIPPTVIMSEAEQATLSRYLEQLAEESLQAAQAEFSWQQDGKTYSAVLIRQRANDGTALEHVTAEVSALDRGTRFTTKINLSRLAFSQFTQMVDRWDPLVQLHDDEIVGRFHSNSGFNLMYDRRAAPKFLGKVTTAARGFKMESSGRRRDSEIFQGGVETRTSPIRLPRSLQPFQWVPQGDEARIHELTSDTHIRFFADGSYTWSTRESSKVQYLNEPSDDPVYFVAVRNATLYVQGVVAGKIMVYSPYRIVIEGSLTYASDPRDTPDSDDYLGLVCDKYIEVAPPGVTGPGDLEIDAAIFAGRRFLVTDIEHSRSATLRIYGSLAAGTLSATEPRYATKIDYDQRFEYQRPPGFPSTDRFEVSDWDGQWSELPSNRVGGNTPDGIDGQRQRP